MNTFCLTSNVFQTFLLLSVLLLQWDEQITLKLIYIFLALLCLKIENFKLCTGKYFFQKHTRLLCYFKVNNSLHQHFKYIYLTDLNQGVPGENTPQSQYRVLIWSSGEIACICKWLIVQNGGQWNPNLKINILLTYCNQWTALVLTV